MRFPDHARRPSRPVPTPHGDRGPSSRRSAAVLAAAALVASAATAAGRGPAAAAADAPPEPRDSRAAGGRLEAAAVHTVRLGNGLRLHVRPVPGTSWVGVVAMHGTGFLDDPPGRTQMAHLAEHLRITAAAGAHGPGERWAALQAIGSSNGETQPTYTSYDHLVPADRLRTVLETEADRLGSLRITAADVAREAPRTAHEARMIAARPEPMLHKFALMAAAQGWAHDRGHAAVLTEPAAVTAEEATAFLARHAAPATFDLLVVGDVDPAAVRTLAEETVGAVAGAPPAAREPDRGIDWSGQPAVRRMSWDLPHAAVIVAHAPRPELAEDAFARLATTAAAAALPATLNADPPPSLHPVLTTFTGWPAGELPVLAVGIVRTGRSADEAAAELIERLDRVAARGLPPMLAFGVSRGHTLPGPPPEAAALAWQARQLADVRGWDRDRAAGVILLNAGLQGLALARAVGSDPEPLRARLAELDGPAIRELLARALAPERRFVTILEPTAGGASGAGDEPVGRPASGSAPGR